jgi:transposase-like protein
MKHHTDNTECPICPHCGAEYPDVLELKTSGEEVALNECKECKQHFLVSVEVTITYTTKIL